MKKIRIYLADDDQDDCVLFEDVINGLPISTQLSVVHNGDQLMQEFRENGDELPNVLFLDLNMPRKNGFECLEEIKHDDKLKHLPVVIISTSLDPHVVELLYKNGARFYIRKPPDFTRLKNVVHEALIRIKEEKNAQPARDDFVLTGDLKTTKVRNEIPFR